MKSNHEYRVAELLSKAPATLKQIIDALNIPAASLYKPLKRMVEAGDIFKEIDYSKMREGYHKYQLMPDAFDKYLKNTKSTWIGTTRNNINTNKTK